MKSGTIKVDGVDLSLVPRSLIRQRCFITVAQDPFILGRASLRFNLDVRHHCYKFRKLPPSRGKENILTLSFSSLLLLLQVKPLLQLLKGHVYGYIFSQETP
jgi:hypothetical protein